MEQERTNRNCPLWGSETCARLNMRACRGCPAVAKGYSGDFYGEDPQCWASEENGLLTPKKEDEEHESRSA